MAAAEVYQIKQVCFKSQNNTKLMGPYFWVWSSVLPPKVGFSIPRNSAVYYLSVWIGGCNIYALYVQVKTTITNFLALFKEFRKLVHS